jgi:hypothetical protein
MISKKKTPPAKRKKPRGEQLLDRIDNNPNDREAWNELARDSPTKLVRKDRSARDEVASPGDRPGLTAMLGIQADPQSSARMPDQTMAIGITESDFAQSGWPLCGPAESCPGPADQGAPIEYRSARAIFLRD